MVVTEVDTTTIPKPLDIAVTMVLLLYLLFIGLHLIILTTHRNQSDLCPQVAGEAVACSIGYEGSNCVPEMSPRAICLM